MELKLDQERRHQQPRSWLLISLKELLLRVLSSAVTTTEMMENKKVTWLCNRRLDWRVDKDQHIKRTWALLRLSGAVKSILPRPNSLDHKSMFQLWPPLTRILTPPRSSTQPELEQSWAPLRLLETKPLPTTWKRSRLRTWPLDQQLTLLEEWTHLVSSQLTNIKMLSQECTIQILQELNWLIQTLTAMVVLPTWVKQTFLNRRMPILAKATRSLTVSEVLLASASPLIQLSSLKVVLTKTDLPVQVYLLSSEVEQTALFENI